MRVLLGGFEPFGGRRVNAAWELLRRVPERLGTRLIRTVRLPVVHGRAWPILAAAIADFRPDAVIAFGEHPGAAVGLERTAINLRRGDRPLLPGGRSAYLASLPLDRLARALRRAGIPAEVSLSAGTYLCNETFYFLMREDLSRRFPKGAGFIHVPRDAHRRWPRALQALLCGL